MAHILFLLAWLVASAAFAADYPVGPIKLVVGFPPSGPTDLAARAVAAPLSQALGQSVHVENRPGAAGTIAAETVARATPDGHTLFLGTTGTLVIAPAFRRDLRYDPQKDFAPLSLLTNAPFLVAVSSSVPVKSLRELIAHARMKPGQLHFGSAGSGQPLHIAGEMFKSAAFVDLVHVPYQGAAPAVADLLAGRIQVVFDQLAAFRPHLQGDKVRLLAVAARERLSQLPDVPTAAEAGLPGFEVSAWFCLVAPRGTPPGTISRLNAEVRKALSSPAVLGTLTKLGFEPAASTPEELAAYIASEAVKWSRAIEAAGIRTP